MELHSDIWSKITEVLVLDIEKEAKRQCSYVWVEYGPLFKNLRRISKKARKGVIAQQRELLKRWFVPYNFWSYHRNVSRLYTYGKALKVITSLVIYPNGMTCSQRYYITYAVEKYNIQDTVGGVFEDAITHNQTRSHYEDLLSKIFPNIFDSSLATSMDAVSEETDELILDRFLPGTLTLSFFINTSNEIHTFLRFRCGKSHGPSIIHFPKKDIMYIFIHEHDSLVVSAKRMSGRFRFHIHQISKDPLIQSYIQALQSSLFTNVISV